jgi:EAL domain-containing protein (putative c-di-GMP-specific phosphodiesterase class I)/sensor domain CHASE-containing protein
MGAFRILMAALLLVLGAAPRAATIDQSTLESHPALRALDDLHGAWLGQLNELITTARALAAADDTYEFVSRPNIPYVSAHYAPEQLAADRIDTVLIVNSHRKPLFWRRVNQGHNRGFPDARDFLAELPSLPVPGDAGTPGIAVAAMLAHGPALVVAMPIYGANGMRRARGWLITARALDEIQWRRNDERAQFSVHALNPIASSLAGNVASVGQTTGRGRSALWVTLLIIITGIVAVKSGVLSAWGAKVGRMRVKVNPADITAAPVRLGGAAPSEIEPTHPSSSKLTLVPASNGLGARQVRDALHARIAATNSVFRYQPQIDLQTGRVAGVEALLCVPGSSGYRPAIELVAEIESAGLGLALLERRLQEACRAQHAWSRKVGHDFAIGVPVSRLMLSNAAMLPLVQRVLAENQLAPSLLELEVEEAALGASAVALRTLNKVHEAGILIAIDGFNASHSNLRLLTILPISKLRIDPWLLLRMGDRVPETQLFAGILGAARGLGIVVCATGVASPDLLAAVLQHGRPLAQGAAVGSLLESSDFLALLRDSNVETVTLPTLDLDQAMLQTVSA